MAHDSSIEIILQGSTDGERLYAVLSQQEIRFYSHEMRPGPVSDTHWRERFYFSLSWGQLEQLARSRP